MFQILVPASIAAYIADRVRSWHPPVKNPKLRRCDPLGCGHFGASRDGGARLHKGLDIVAMPGQAVYAPMSGTVSKFVTSRGLSGVSISDNKDMSAKVIYVNPKQGIDVVSKGDFIGFAQDIRPTYGAGITNHIHVEAIKNGKNVNPLPMFPLAERVFW